MREGLPAARAPARPPVSRGCACRRPLVVVAAGAVGLAGAVELGRGSLLAAALLVQLKTLLDNADGQLARLTGRTSAFGRYLDSEVDLLVNAALFAALGLDDGPPDGRCSSASSRSRASSASTSTSNGSRGPASAEPEAEAREARPRSCAGSTASSTRRRTGSRRRSSRGVRLSRARLACRCSPTSACRRSSPCSVS